MGNGDSSPRTGGRRTRYAVRAAVAVLALTGSLLVVAAVRRTPVEPPETAPPATAPEPARPATPDRLTRGPLMATSPPARLTIPAIKVSVPVIGLGQNADGTMQVPGDAATVGWYTKAPTPGSLGPAVMAGHVDFHRRPGTFARLATLAAGDIVTIARQDGSTATFSVTKTARYAKDRFPTDAVYGAIDHAGLRLITCGGDFDDRAGHYRDNIVVFATLS
ncbi:class F sortase [Actinoplanes sp. NPDC089786]|uniref:class F sortase n=1 Tax=Actinoplanes sp. NPDC089786 TaxID=3155185 RepID=UPI003421B6AE